MENSQVSGKHLALILISASLAVFMSSLDGTIVNIALPVISDYFDLSTSSVEWVSTIYLLVMAGTLLIIGKITDIVGLKKIFLIGFILFTVGSFTCGFLPEKLDMFSALLASRVLQGLGGAMMTVIAPAMISKYMPGARRAKGMTIVTVFAAIGMALGPTLGGYLTEYLSWNWIFYINVPVGIIAVIIGLFVLPKDSSSKSSFAGFDVKGAALIFVGLASLLFGVSEGNTQGWTSLPILIAIIVGLACLAGFVVCELKVKQPVFDLRLFKNRSFILLNLVLIIMFITFAGANYLLPFYLEYVQGLSTSNSGLVLTVMSFGMMVTGLISGFIYAKLIGKIKYLLIIGGVLMALGFFALSRLSPLSGLTIVIIGLAFLGLGLGFMVTPITTLIMGSVSPDKQGMISSITGLERFAPMTLGIALFNILFVQAIKFNVVKSGITEMPPADIAASILSNGFDFCFLISFIISLIIVVMCIFVKEKEMHCES